MATTLAVITVTGADEGVSTDMHCTFLRAVERGREYIVDARVTKLGRNLMYTEATISAANDPGKVAMRVVHTKFLPPTGSGTAKL